MNFETPLPDLQLSFYERLREISSTFLLEALLDAVSSVDIEVLDHELREFGTKDGLRKLAGWGLRGEIMFPIPSLLRANPSLLGYYRLLLGFSQKQLYGKDHGIGPFKSMEEGGTLSANQNQHLPALCRCLGASASYFVNAVDYLSQDRVHDLTLITLGSQLRGSQQNRIGQKATRRVFDLIKSLVASHIIRERKDFIEIESAAGRNIRIAFAADPDIALHSELPSGQLRPILAIEIKGGKDISNVHNRIGEAEKSHQKARKQGFTECWTIVGVSKLDTDLAHRESPSTNRFFLLHDIVDPNSEQFREFEEQLHSRLGV